MQALFDEIFKIKGNGSDRHNFGQNLFVVGLTYGWRRP